MRKLECDVNVDIVNLPVEREKEGFTVNKT